MTTRSTKLGAALRARFPGGPRQALRALGLDESMLPAPPPAPRHDNNGAGEGNGEGSRLKKLRWAIERLLHDDLNLSDEQMARVADLLEQHAPADGHDEEPDTDEAFVEFLKDKGLGEDDCQRALDLVHKATKGARDFAAGEPKNNFAISGERGRGSELASDAALRRRYPEVARLLPALPPMRPAERLVTDRRSVAPSKKFHERYPGSNRIQSI